MWYLRIFQLIIIYLWDCQIPVLICNVTSNNNYFRTVIIELMYWLVTVLQITCIYWLYSSKSLNLIGLSWVVVKMRSLWKSLRLQSSDLHVSLCVITGGFLHLPANPRVVLSDPAGKCWLMIPSALEQTNSDESTFGRPQLRAECWFGEFACWAFGYHLLRANSLMIFWQLGP